MAGGVQGRPGAGEGGDPHRPAEAGNFGDCKPVGEGVWELRVDWGPGYRVYYAIVGAEVVLLLCGGDKRKQAADIRRAAEFLKDYRRRTTAL